MTARKGSRGRLHATSVLESHQDQLTDGGRDLYGKIFRMVNRGEDLEKQCREMSEGDMIVVGNLIRDLFYDTQSNYFGEA